MMDPAERQAIPPFKLAAAGCAAALCIAIIYNALAGQDGRQRDVLSRLSDLEQQGTLPVTIGVGTLEPRPTTKANVTIEALAGLAAAEAEQDAITRQLQRELAALGIYGGALDGQDGPLLRQAIAAYQRERGLEVTGQPTDRLLDHIRLGREILQAASPPAETAVDVRSIQDGLARLGSSPGPGDGRLGPRTQEAIRMFERDRNLPETGSITDALTEEIARVLAGG